MQMCLCLRTEGGSYPLCSGCILYPSVSFREDFDHSKLTFAEEFEYRKIQLCFLLMWSFHAGKVADVESRCHTEIRFLWY